MGADEKLQLPSFATEDEAWAEVSRRNRLSEQERRSPLHGYFKPDSYWLAVELPSGEWTVAETTGPKKTKRQRFLGVLGDVLNPFDGP
jgi:hypothetical protein